MRGTLEERRPGVFRYRLSAGKVGGRYREHSATFKASGVKAARRHATQLAASWDRADAEGAARADTVNGLLDEWVAFRESDGESPATAYRRRSIEREIRDGLGHIRLDDLDAHDIDLWVVGLIGREVGKGRRPIGPATARHYLRVLSSVLAQGEKWGKLDRNPARRARAPKVTKQDQTPHMPTVEAWRVLVAAASPTVRIALLLAATTGVRRGELVGLRWSDIDADGMLTVSRSIVKVPGGELVVKPPKSGRVRRLRVPAGVLEELVGYRRWQVERAATVARVAGGTLAGDGPILANLTHDATGRTHYAPDWLSQEWERLRVRVGMPGIKLHGLRHLHASLLVEAGASLAGVQGRMGHAALSTTLDMYSHGSPGADDAAAATLDRIFRPAELEESTD